MHWQGLHRALNYSFLCATVANFSMFLEYALSQTAFTLTLVENGGGTPPPLFNENWFSHQKQSFPLN